MNIDSTYILERDKQDFCSLYSITLFVEILGYKLNIFTIFYRRKGGFSEIESYKQSCTSNLLITIFFVL